MRTLLFISGIVILAACLAAPLPFFDIDYPFSAHMLRHTLLLLVAAPLLALGIPANNITKNTLTRISKATARFPFLTWLTGVGLMWVWHIPTLYNTMSMTGMSNGMSLTGVPSTILAVLHPLSLLAGGWIFCWPILTPYAPYRLPPLSAVGYLASACVFCSLLGLLIAFAPAATYVHVSPNDRQTGGLIMWVPCCFLYLSASMYLLIRWLSPKKESPSIHHSTNDHATR